jgi:hypothetical protein
MFRRMMLAITFIAALGAAGLATTNTAEAQRWDRGYYSGYYYGPRVYGGYVSPYRTYYPGGYVTRYYGPRYYAGPRVYRRGFYRPYFYGPDYSYYGRSPRVAVRVGW